MHKRNKQVDWLEHRNKVEESLDLINLLFICPMSRAQTSSDLHKNRMQGTS